MLLDTDPEKRKWIELAGANPSSVANYRPALVRFLAFSRSYEPAFVGTGFIIAGDDKGAIVVTAKHVLQEGVLRIQKPESGKISTNIFVTARSITPAIDPQKLRLTWGNAQTGSMLKVIYVEYCDSLDIAICWAIPEDGDNFRPTTIPLDITVPVVGDEVHMISFDQLQVREIRPPSTPMGGNHVLEINTRVSIRIGKVTGVYQAGLRQYDWPCFTTSIPAEPGMSGGLVTIPRHAKTTGACGIVCADNSSDAARKSSLKSGESVIACAWPALALRLPEMDRDEAPRLSLYEMMRAGYVPPAIGNLDRVEFTSQGDDRSIGLKPGR